MGNKTHINSAKLFVGKGVTLMVSWDDFLHLNQRFFVAFIAAVIAIWVMIVNVEIDSTIQTLILTLSPIIVAYWWPEAKREPVVRQDPEDPTKLKGEGGKTSRKSVSGFDPDVAVALAFAFLLYLGVQAYLAYQAPPDLTELLASQAPPDLTEPAAPPGWAKIVIGLLPVIVGALTSPKQS
jgi:hypothetical protein